MTVEDYDAWIVKARAKGEVGNEAWGRWVCHKYVLTGKAPDDPYVNRQPVNSTAPVEDVNKSELPDLYRKTYMREYMKRKRQEVKEINERLKKGERYSKQIAP